MVTIFYGSVCSKGKGGGCQILSPTRESYELDIMLEFAYTNNQAEYEALLCGLAFMRDMGVRSISSFGNSKLVVQQMNGENQCLEGMLNKYRDACLDIVKPIDDFCINYIPRHKNRVANTLAQQASGYKVSRGKFMVKRKPALWNTVWYDDEPAREYEIEGEVKTSSEPTSFRHGSESVSEGGNMGNAWTTGNGEKDKEPLQMEVSAEDDGVGRKNWTQPLVDYLQNPSNDKDKKV
jgi:ribonuclease HI